MCEFGVSKNDVKYSLNEQFSITVIVDLINKQFFLLEIEVFNLSLSKVQFSKIVTSHLYK